MSVQRSLDQQEERLHRRWGKAATPAARLAVAVDAWRAAAKQDPDAAHLVDRLAREVRDRWLLYAQRRRKKSQ